MPDKVVMFVLGGLSTAAALSFGSLLYYQWRQSRIDQKVMLVDKKRYLDLIESLGMTRGELELTMKNMVANETRTSDGDDFGTPPSGSLKGLNLEEISGQLSTDSLWVISNDGFHGKEFNEMWHYYIENNKNLDYYISCAIEYAQSPIRIRTIRTQMLNLNDDVDYIIKVIAVRGAFNLLNDDLSNVNWLIEALRSCFAHLLEIANKPITQFDAAFDDLLSFAMDSKNTKQIEEELLEAKICEYNVYDVVLDFMILDSLGDLDCLPSAILSVTKSRFITRSLRENAFCTLVWSYIQSKIKTLKSPNGFLAKYYNLCHTISPVLAWGFLGDNGALNTACNDFKNCVMKFIVNIFNEEEVSYENKFDLADDILKSAKKNHRDLIKQFQALEETN